MTKASPNQDLKDDHSKSKPIKKGFRPSVETQSTAEDALEVVSIASDQPHQNVVELRQNLTNNSAADAHGGQVAQNVIDFENVEVLQPRERNLIQGRLTAFGFTTAGNQIPFHVICRECGFKLKNKISKVNERGRRCHQRHQNRLGRF